MGIATAGMVLAADGKGAGFSDDGAYRWVVSLAKDTPWLHLPVTLWTSFGIVLPVLLAVLGLWLGRGRGLDTLLRAAWVPGAMVVAFVISAVIKSLVAEHRPCQVILVKTVEKCPGVTDYAFPSNHSVLAAAGAVALFGLGSRLGWIGVVNAVLVAFTRVYLGVHYPHDVIVGVIVGGVVAGTGLLSGRALLPVIVPALEHRLPATVGKRARPSEGSRDTIPQ